jgi:hypothetical protein
LDWNTVCDASRHLNQLKGGKHADWEKKYRNMASNYPFFGKLSSQRPGFTNGSKTDNLPKI